MSHRTAAIIVTFEPQLETLAHLIEALQAQVGAIILVDNASANLAAWKAVLPSGVRIISLTSNEGIAAALNRGFEHIQAEDSFDFCALFDQDSAPSVGMIDQLEMHHDQLAPRGPIAQVGPYFFEHNRGYHLPFIESRYGFPIRKRDTGSANFTTADYLISSGALVSMNTLRAVGKMDESLFIDYVDIEWGLRARAAGFQSYGAFNVRMEHRIGEGALQFAGMRLAIHKPLRRYYYYRNAILLCRRPYIPLAWKINEIVRLSLKFLIFAIRSKRRTADVRMMSRGIVDGLRGISGKFQARTRRNHPHP
ncbi:MAG: glycosyltransferase family 2 protein [Janthinobacterium lividum]